MFVEKYLNVFSRRIKGVVFIIFQIFFATREILENWGISVTDGQTPVFRGDIQSSDVLSPILASEARNLVEWESK